jgi:hypothetical protein
MEIKGRIQLINDTVVVSDKFKKRTFVVVTDETYPQEIEMQMTQDKCDLLDAFGVDNNVSVSINLRGRAWTNPQGETKYFNTVEAWKVDKVDTLVANLSPDAMDDLGF